MSKEITDLLEKARSVYSGYGSSERYVKLSLYLDQALELLKQQPPAGEFTKEAEEFFRTCTEWFDSISVPQKADLYGYKGEPAIKVALEHIQSLLNNYQNVESFRKGYLELNKRNIKLQARLDASEASQKDLLDMCKMAVQEWQEELSVCGDPDCDVCVKRRKQIEQVKVAIAKQS